MPRSCTRSAALSRAKTATSRAEGARTSPEAPGAGGRRAPRAACREVPPAVPARRARLERPSLSREQEFLAAVRRSRALHGIFVEPPSSTDEYHHYLRRQKRPAQASFFVIEPDEGALAGVINVNDIVRDSVQSASLGYYAFVPHAGHGLMRDGLYRVIGWCFRDLGLHRLEASIQPVNERSIRLVRGLGFRLEGVSRRYLKVRGRWRDHARWSLLAEEWRGREG